MSLRLKYRMCQILVAATIPLMCYMFSHMIPAGLNGDTATVKKWFTASMVTVVIGCGAYIAARVYKLRLETHSETDGVDVLSAAAADLAKAKSLRAVQPQTTASQHNNVEPPKQAL